jgi:hypothetical protein
MGLLLAVTPRVVVADVLPVLSPNAQADGAYGQSVAIIGDIDADGSDDLLVGAPTESATGLASAGRAYLYSGRTGQLIRTHVSFYAQSSGAFGWAVVGLGDVNGDGRGDYAIGAPFEASNDVGHVYVYSGATGTMLWDLAGPGLATGFGGALAEVPDLNNDGRAELLIGYAGITGDAPAVSVYQAKNGAILQSFAKPAGGGNFHKFGQSVASVPDLTGDGKADVLVGAPSWDFVGTADAGAVFVYNGSAGGFIGALSSVDAQLSGGFGRAVAGVPDLDGDGKGDIVVGAPTEIPTGESIRAGQVHVYSGATRSFIRTLSSALPTEQGIFGTAVGGTDDVTGDGRGDIVVGAALEGPAPNLGRVYRFDGALGTAMGPVWQAPEAGAAFGMAISVAGDCTQDGKPDVAIGAPFTKAGTLVNAGKAHLHRLVPNEWCSSLYSVPVVSEGWHYLTNIGAEGSSPSEQACSAHGETVFDADVFVRYAPSATGYAMFTTCGQSSFDSRLAIYQAADPIGVVCDLSDLVGCNDDDIACADGSSRVEIPVSAEATYWVRIGGVQGEEGTAGLTIVLDESCNGDLNADGVIDGADLAVLLGQWGTPGTTGDLNHDDVVDGADLAVVLGAWGLCE